jgi:hypothetical protein
MLEWIEKSDILFKIEAYYCVEKLNKYINCTPALEEYYYLISSERFKMLS